MSTPAVFSTKGYLPALDSLRGMAILIVVIGHYGLKNVVSGGFGVTLFFFISGFLITRLLLAEFAETQRIDLRGFYIRRVLRLYPALLAMVMLSVLFTVGLGCGFQPDEVLSTLFYYRNYYMVYSHDRVHIYLQHTVGPPMRLYPECHFHSGPCQ